MSIANVISLINTYIFSNTSGDITGDELHNVLIAVLGQIGGAGTYVAVSDANYGPWTSGASTPGSHRSRLLRGAKRPPVASLLISWTFRGKLPISAATTINPQHMGII